MSFGSAPKYIPNPKHRGQHQGESRWTITENEEHESFQRAWHENWCIGNKGFGLHLVQDVNGKFKPQNLGLIEDHKTMVFIAKFVSDPNHQWHGYPADHRKKQDRPERAILQKWIAAELVPGSKIRKIGCGQRCIL
jgi:hypothetical protein